MKLLDRWRKWMNERRQRRTIRASLMKQATARKAVCDEIIQAIHAGNFTLASQLRTKLDSLPCPTCGRNSGE